MKKHIRTIVLVLVAFTIGYFVGDSSAVKRANEQIAWIKLQYELEANESSTSELIKTTSEEDSTTSNWREVITFKGESIKDTETFKISSDEWRINWETKPGDIGEMNFQIYVYDKNGNSAGSYIAANVIGEGNDISYMRGSGEYYLTINTAQSYTIIIEEKN